MSGDIEWWVTFLSYKVQIVWLFVFGIFLGFRKTRLTLKQALQIGVYTFSALKDVFDWLTNWNIGTKYIDWTITVVLLLAVEFLYDRVRGMIKNGNGSI